MKLKALMRRGGGFGLYALLPAAVSIVSVPIVISVAGAIAFAGLAVAQTVGSLIAIPVGYGWGYIGPTAVALLPERERPQYYLDALVSRVVVLAGLLPVLVALILILTPQHDSVVVGVLMALSLGLPGLTGNWYFVGQGRPRDLLIFDMAPNTGATIIGAALLEAGAGLTVYAAIQAAGALLAITGTAIRVHREEPDAQLHWHLRPATRRLTNKRGREAAVMALTTGAYINVPVLVVAQFCPAVEIAMYALANKLQKVAVQICSPLTSVAQGYVPSPGNPEEQSRRMRQAVLGCTAAGTVVGIGFAALAPEVSTHFSGGHLHVPFSVSIPLGLSVTMISISGVVALACLATLGRTAEMTRGAVAGAVIGVGTAVWWTSTSGPAGVSWSVAAAEGATAIYQAALLWRAFRAEPSVISA